MKQSMAKIKEKFQKKIERWLGRNLKWEIHRKLPMGVTVVEFYLGDRKVGEVEVFDIDLAKMGF